MGEELAKAELAKGGRPTETSRADRLVNPTLADIGITKDQSSRYQHLAGYPGRAVDLISAVTRRHVGGTDSAGSG
jgi:hypothetical protein